MKKHKSWLFGFSEINLILWLCMFGFFMRADFTSPENVKMAKYFSLVGFILAALLQHWAYYNVYKPARDKQKDEKRQHKAVDDTSQ
jgi:hypothetical protein